MTGIGRNWSKWPFLGQNGRFWAKMAIFGPFLGQMAKTRFFWGKAKMSLPYAYYAATLCKKPEQTYERIRHHQITLNVNFQPNQTKF